ncbi:MAG: amino acid transporter, partial [Streptomyces sp.]
MSAHPTADTAGKTSPGDPGQSPPRDPNDPQSSQNELEAGLKNRHLSMIAIGGVIGAGLFVGSSAGIAAAGPAILLSYALVGAMVVCVMRMLGEMAAANPTSGSFSAY